jgi:hypothetical protein
VEACHTKILRLYSGIPRECLNSRSEPDDRSPASRGKAPDGRRTTAANDFRFRN